MLKPVQQDKQGELKVAERVLGDRIRSFQDDKAGGWALAGSLMIPPIRFLAALEMTREEGGWKAERPIRMELWIGRIAKAVGHFND